VFRYGEVPPALAALHGFMRVNNVSARDVFSAVDTDGSGTLEVGLPLQGGGGGSHLAPPAVAGARQPPPATPRSAPPVPPTGDWELEYWTDAVGLYTLNPFDPQLDSAWFLPPLRR
jgi:hypothetical protein